MRTKAKQSRKRLVGSPSYAIYHVSDGGGGSWTLNLVQIETNVADGLVEGGDGGRSEQKTAIHPDETESRHAEGENMFPLRIK